MSDPTNKRVYSADTVPTLDNQQEQRQKRRRKYAIFITSLPLVFHAFFVATTACFVLVYLNGRDFGVYHRDRRDDVVQAVGRDVEVPFFQRWTPLQTDMITTLSVLLVVTRFFLMAWYADVAWKYIFILLEQTGLSVSQIRDLIKYKVLLKSGLPSSSLPTGVQGHHILVALVLFLPFPAHFSAPIISGSITWTPSYDLLPGAPLSGVTTYANGEHWTLYQTFSVHRYDIISQAGRYHNLFYTSAHDASLKRSLSAAIPRSFAPNSTVANITMPFFSLSNLTWVTNISSVPLDQLQAIDVLTGRMNVTDFGQTVIRKGSMALIPSRKWEQAKPTSSGFEDPPAVTLSQKMYLAFWPRFKSDTTGFCNESAYDYENIPIPSTVDWYTLPNNTNNVCYMFATVDVVAGAKICRDCTIENSQIVAIDDSKLPKKLDDTLQADPLVDQVIWLMPQVLTLMSQTGITLPNDGGLDNYVKTLIGRAYVVSWSALIDFASNDGTNLTTDVTAAVTSTRAILSHPRVIVWIAFQSLAWLAAGIFALVQHRCKRPLTADTIMAAIFLDSDDLVREEARNSGLSDVVAVSSERHNRRLGVLKLEFDPKDRHSHLVKWRPRPGPDPEKEN